MSKIVSEVKLWNLRVHMVNAFVKIIIFWLMKGDSRVDKILKNAALSLAVKVENF